MSGRWLVLGAVIVAGVAIALIVMIHGGDPEPIVVARTEAPPPPPPPDTPPIDARAVDVADAAVRSPLETLRASGSGHEIWDDQATALLSAFDGAHTAIECYIAGCAATFTFASDDRYRDAAAKLIDSDAYRAWTGGKVLTAPERRDGRVSVTLLLYRPD